MVMPCSQPMRSAITVSCVQTGECVAVSGSAPLSLTRSSPGSQWVQNTPPPSGVQSISCFDSSICLVLGAGTGSDFYSWDGAAWTTLPPLPAKATTGYPLQTGNLTCTSPEFCVAVGNSVDLYDGDSAAIQMWNGTGWKDPVLIPPVAHPANSALTDVSCASPSFCMAVGEQDSSFPLVEEWNGTQWISLPTTAQQGVASLDAVSCPTRTFCFAVGTNEGRYSGQSQFIADEWNGSTWSPAPAPQPLRYDPGSSQPALVCQQAPRCLSIWSPNSGSIERLGATTSGDADLDPTSQLWNGKSWTPVSMPSPPPTSNEFDIFNDESCVSVNDCVAVGVRMKEGQATSLIDSWNGSAWTSGPIAN